MSPPLDPWNSLITVGPIVRVTVAPHPLDTDELEHLGFDVPTISAIPLLVDTGAPHTLVEQSIVAPLGLVPFNFYTFHARAAQFEVRCPLHRARVTLHVDNGPVVLDTTISTTGEASCFPEGMRYRGLLGRSTLQKLKFLYDGPAGTFNIWKPPK